MSVENVSVDIMSWHQLQEIP